MKKKRKIRITNTIFWITYGTYGLVIETCDIESNPATVKTGVTEIEE